MALHDGGWRIAPPQFGQRQTTIAALLLRPTCSDQQTHAVRGQGPGGIEVEGGLARGHHAPSDVPIAALSAVVPGGNVNDVVPANGLLHGVEDTVFADSGYRGAHKRPDAKPGATWHIAVRPSDRKWLKAGAKLGAIRDKIETLKASVRAKVEHPFRVIKRQFGHTKVRYRGLFKNTAQLKTLFALSNLWMARLKLMALDEQVRPLTTRTA